MRILHITPHLGGGVGKAHAAMSAILADAVEQRFLLLEEARDRRYADLVARSGAAVATARRRHDVADAARAADIVQFEFWNHPRLFECLAAPDLPALRSVFWSHISGLSRPVVQPALVGKAGRFVFTSPVSLSLPFVTSLPEEVRRNTAVINSGFGFADRSQRSRRAVGPPVIAYLGTVDFHKMHPGFFDAVDRLERDDVRVAVWGEPSAAVRERVRAMRHPERIDLGGQTTDPAAALAEADIFFYPLQPRHYGTAENALVEAMSLGLAPVVLNNPAESAIVCHGTTGFVARSVDECVMFLDRLVTSPDLRNEIARNAATDVAETRTPGRSARQFVELWRGLMREPARTTDFRSVIGEHPADWFLATQVVAGQPWNLADEGGADVLSKGTLAHFMSVFPDDVALARLREGGSSAGTATRHG